MAATFKGRGASILLPSSKSFTLNISPAIGDWMMAIFTAENKAELSRSPTPPTGWTTIQDFQTVGSGTMGFGLFAKMYTGNPSELSWTNTYVPSLTNTRVVSMFGSGGDISTWDIGEFGIRELNATTTTAKSPAIFARRAGLALLIVGERTAAAETDAQITIDNGFQKIFTDQSFTAIPIVASKTVTAGPISNTTIQFPNAHSNNAIAAHIVIPDNGTEAPAVPYPTATVKVADTSGWTSVVAKPKVRQGSGWVNAKMKYWNGTEWVLKS